MPVYEFECPNCGKIKEMSISLQEYASDFHLYCADCKEEMKRIMSKTTFVLKGSGWAKDGYSKGKK